MVENGIILVDKPAGISSFGVVARVRWRLTEAKRKQHEARGFCTPMQRKEDANRAISGTNAYRERAVQQSDAAGRGEPAEQAGSAGLDGWRCKCRVKVGHTGTLDPFATGLMILVVGKECKNAETYSKLDKVYEATIRLGETSSTGDPEGEKQVISKKQPAIGEIQEAFEKFTGTIMQIPPNYSAIKVGGQRAYKLARAGTVFEISKREVTVFSLDLVEYSYPHLKIRAHVSSGTYIRTLAEDIGAALGVGAYCSELRRISIGKWDISKVTKEFTLDI